MVPVSQLEKDPNVSENDGAEINNNLAFIETLLLKEKPEEDKLSETSSDQRIVKLWLKPGLI